MVIVVISGSAIAQDTVTVSNNRQAARALGNQSVSTIQLAYGACTLPRRWPLLLQPLQLSVIKA